MSDWQPIETAPRDGSWFLVWLPHSSKHELPRLAHWTIWPRYDRGTWTTPKEREFVFTGCGPTEPPAKGYWYPLPDPPEEQ